MTELFATHLGDKECLAIAYSNLGDVYQDQGDLTQAEAMHRQALALYEALGAKPGIAGAYANLGIVYRIQGDLTQAEAMHRQALALLQEIGAAAQMEKVQKLLHKLHTQGSP